MWQTKNSIEREHSSDLVASQTVRVQKSTVKPRPTPYYHSAWTFNIKFLGRDARSEAFNKNLISSKGL